MVTGTELIVDGGFESGDYGSTYGVSGVSGPWAWSAQGAFERNPINGGQGGYTHSGTWIAYFPLGGSFMGGETDSEISQRVSIPSGVTATLSFWLSSTGASGNCLACVGGSSADTLWVNLNGNSLLVDTFKDSNAAGFDNWVKHTYDVSAFAGQTVTLSFTAHDIGATLFAIDDVSLIIIPSNATCTEDALTGCFVNGRYKVTSRWLNQYATPPQAANLNKVKLTDNVGAFWIADANTYEYFIRFNTASTNGKLWINLSSFTSVEYWVTVTDTVSHQTKEYHSPAGTDAFNTVNIWDPYYFVYP